jgi:NADH dehydrogenase (ubiquinone) Fe-S protein 1
VRFAEEIAGVDDLGMFGRGSSSEIGTYIEKNFQSELSGNVIDLCPVGALTSKPYAFVKRNWELKTISSIDFTDGFSSSIQLSLKNNKIVKVQPGFNRCLKDFNWISDKARFAFEGSFSLDRYSEGYVQNSTSNIKKNLSWTELLEEICSILYFQDIINSYRFNLHKLIVIIDNNISLEALTMLITLSRSVPIIAIRKAEGRSFNLDIESDFLINSNFDTSLQSSNLCLLIGVNTRYEGLSLNLKLCV